MLVFRGIRKLNTFQTRLLKLLTNLGSVDFLYILLEGKINLKLNKNFCMKTLIAGDLYGDVHILTNSPTFVTAKSE